MEISWFTAFTAGLVTFLAPCTFASLPIFISYLAMQSTHQEKNTRLRIFLSALVYVIGFMLVFIAIWTTATSFSRYLVQNKHLFVQIGAVVTIAMGLLILFGERFPRLHFLFGEKKIEINPERVGHSYLFPFTLGMTNAFTWSPCIGPILTSILFLAGSQSESPLQGAFLLFLYALGINLPFLVIAATLERSKGFIKRFAKYTAIIHKLSAALLIIIGILFLLGFADIVFNYLFNIFTYFGYQPV